jgi:hypothetical protein
LTQVTSTDLKEELPKRYEFVDSLEVILVNARREINILPGNASNTISFLVDTDSFSTTNYSIMYWDQALAKYQGGWVELPILPKAATASDYDQPLHPENLSDQQVVYVPAYKMGTSRIQVTTNFTGIFVLVKK